MTKRSHVKAEQPDGAGGGNLRQCVEAVQSMADFTVNTQRHDPYKNFKFRLLWDGRYVAGVSSVSPLRRSSQVVLHREGSDPGAVRRSPGVTSYEPIRLARGRTHDLAFEQWANKVWNLDAAEGQEVSLKDFRKDIAIELFNEAGQKVMAFHVFRCWPSEYVALGELEANGAAAAFESMTLEHEGWERDQSVVEPTEPSYTEPNP